MPRAVTVAAGSRHVAQLRFTSRADGDLAVDAPGVEARRSAVAPTPWSWLRQVHGADVVRVERPGEAAGAEADALVTAVPDCVLAVQTADCAPIVVVGDGELAVVHAGWRGLLAGVVEAAVEQLDTPPGQLSAHLGPVIRPHAYEFAGPELDRIAARLGDDVRATTTQGTPALDVAAAVRSALDAAGVAPPLDHGLDTADAGFWSHRCRGEAGRQSTVAWLEPA